MGIVYMLLLFIAIVMLITLGEVHDLTQARASAVCVDYEKIDWKDKRIDDLNLEINQWYCFEWANKTEINPAWIDNCCIDTDVSLTDDESEYHSSGKIDKVEIGFKLSKTHKIDIELCHITPREIPTNESICIVQKRRGW